MNNSDDTTNEISTVFVMGFCEGFETQPLLRLNGTFGTFQFNSFAFIHKIYIKYSQDIWDVIMFN